MNVFERFRAERPDFDGVLFIRGYEAGIPDDRVVLFLSSGRGHDILAITVDGQLHFTPGYTPTQQAEAFRQAMNMASQRALFPLAPAPFEGMLAPAEETGMTDAVYFGGIPNPAARAQFANATEVLLTDEELTETARHFDRREIKPTDPGWKDVPYPDKLL